MLDTGLSVHHPHLDRSEVRMRPHVVPEVGVVLDRPGLDHEADAPHVVVPVGVRGRDPDPREGAKDRGAGGEQAGGVGAPERRVGRQGQQHGNVDTHAVGHVDGLVGPVDPHVHVGPEDQLLAGDEAQVGHQVAVALALGDPLVLPHRERVGARRAGRQPVLDRLRPAPGHAGRVTPVPPRACPHTAWSRSRGPTPSAPASRERPRRPSRRASPRSSSPDPASRGRRA